MPLSPLTGLRRLRRSPQRPLLDVIKATNRLLSVQGESNSASMANDLMAAYRGLDDSQREAFFNHLATLNPNPQAVLAAAQAYEQQPDAKNLIALFEVTEPPRQELLRRLNRSQGGTEMIVGMRHQLLKMLSKKPELKAVDADMGHLLNSWFNPGFLKMHRVDWHSPAHILEKIIHHEAVHEIDGWDDLRRRLAPDRRCFAFFHPQLPDEPLIFVEVALVPTIADAVGPLVDKKSEPLPSKDYKCAIFYSISNCQPGLRGVSMGNFLIKRVAQRLHDELPTLKTYCTLSPIPGFLDWLSSGASFDGDPPAKAVLERVEAALNLLDLKGKSWPDRLSAGWKPEKANEAEREALMRLCAVYLTHHSPHRSGNSVAKFHLGNGAQLYRINWAADLSKKGLRQSAGLMVNYLYDLQQVEENHERFGQGEVVRSRAVTRLI